MEKCLGYNKKLRVWKHSLKRIQSFCKSCFFKRKEILEKKEIEDKEKRKKKKKKVKLNNIPELNNIPDVVNKYIHGSFVVYFSKKLKKKEVEEIAEDMTMILLNTKSIFSTKEEFKGCMNSYLNINTLVTSKTFNKEVIVRKISKFFIPKVTKEKGKWKIVLTSLKENGEPDLYSLPLLFYDKFILVQVNKWILERYKIKAHSNEKNFSPFIHLRVLNGHPTIEFNEHLLKLQYEVYWRLQEYEMMKELDKKVFGEDFYEMINRINKERKKLKLNNEQKLWWKKVEKILKEKKQFNLIFASQKSTKN